MSAQRTTVYRHAELVRLLHPGSIAVIGASARAGSFGERVLDNLVNYTGAIYPVNARYERIGERVCYPSVAALPQVPDCAVVTVAREAVEAVVLDCARAGVGGVCRNRTRRPYHGTGASGGDRAGDRTAHRWAELRWRGERND